MSGMFITFEGIDGVGKTFIMQVVGDWLRKKEMKLLCLFEPGSSSIGQPIRKLIFDKPEISLLAQAFLFMANRAQHLEEKIIPALQNKTVVLCDRYQDSTIAYQSSNKQEREYFFDFYSKFFLKPNLTFLISASEETIRKRIQKRKNKNHFDKKNADFRKQVMENYLWLKRQDNERIFYILNNHDPQKTANQVIQIIQWKFEEQKAKWFQKALKKIIKDRDNHDEQ